MPEGRKPVPPQGYCLEFTVLKVTALADLVGGQNDLGCVNRDGLGLLLADLAWELQVLARERAARAAGP